MKNTLHFLMVKLLLSEAFQMHSGIIFGVVWQLKMNATMHLKILGQ